MNLPRKATGRAYIRDGLYYNPRFLLGSERDAILKWLKTIHPIWEERFSEHNPPPAGDEQRSLLRPVYWLGNWQFACLDYYHPPKGITNRCIEAEAYPLALSPLVKKIELMTRKIYHPSDIPKGWQLNTCLINFYGSKIEKDGKKNDTARVGEHKDFEPGPVASLSLGERAMFQFTTGQATGQNILLEQWLDDSSLQIFGGEKWKSRAFHRVQRVDKKEGYQFDLNVENFETRRINFTFRYVPKEHIIPYRSLPPEQKADTLCYMENLSQYSPFFKKALS
ncbi:MAG: alpha-ketoglutarate-dependent dioxygenase AlkB [Bacteriovoracaceae bacterium]